MPSKSKTLKSRSKSVSISPEQKPLDHNRHNKTKRRKQKKQKRSSVLYSLKTDKDFDKIMKRMELFGSKK